jgi:two-component system response regulator
MTDQNPLMTILSAEDDPDDCLLVEDAFHESGQKGRLIFVGDGISLLQYLRREGDFAEPAAAPRPDLILLDLNMPRMDGRESLAKIKADPDLRSIPVVILTTSNAEEDIMKTYELGGAGYITKPASFQGMLDLVKCLNFYWFKIVKLIDKRKPILSL